jgi:hypothetical protein
MLRSFLSKVLRNHRHFPPRLCATTGPQLFTRMANAPSRFAPRAADLLSTNVPASVSKMAPEERRRLDVVLSEPRSIEARLWLADYYLKLGDPRGAWIRDSLADPTLAPPAEIIALVDAQFAPWSGRDFVWEGGLVVGMSLAGRAFLSGIDAILRLAPVQTIRLVAIQPFLDELARCDSVSKLRCLDLSGNRIGDEGFAKIAHLRVSEWILHGNDLTQPILNARM